MSLEYYFGSSSKIWSSIEWVYGIEDAGYTGWEISAEGNYRLDRPECFSRIKETLETTKLKATVHAPFSDLNLASINDPIYRESIRQFCECVRLTSEISEKMTLHPGYLSPAAHTVSDKIWTMHKEALVEIGKAAVEYGVTVGLENMPNIPDFLCMDADEIEGMVYGVEGIGITIDFGHANTNGQVDNFIKKLPLAKHIHLHDNNGEHDDHLAVGEGNIDWRKVGKAVKSKYSGICVVEGRNLEDAAKSREAVREYF